MGHTIPFLKETGYSLWYGMQVPLFVLIQSFHALKKESYSFSIKKISKRIIYPFLLIQIIPIVYEFFINGYTNKLITSWLIGGVYGSGAYYPWIYLQLAFLLAIIRPYLEKGTKTLTLIVVLAICEGLEISTTIIGLPDWLYRLLAIIFILKIFRLVVG